MSRRHLSSVQPPPVVRPPPNGRPKNRLLAALPTDDFERLRPHLKTVPIRVRQVLYKLGEPLRYVYFPNGGVASITTMLRDGTMVEAATVGDEGMLGIEAFLSEGALSPGEVLMQVPDTDAEIMTVEQFRYAIAERRALYDLLGRYTQVVIAQMMQSTACNAVHSVEQRLARWLLTAHDRMRSDEFPLTQEFVAMMLGATRPTVTVVAGALQKAGLIRYHRGHVTIVNRRKLEAASCECYRASTDMLQAVSRSRRSRIWRLSHRPTSLARTHCWIASWLARRPASGIVTAACSASAVALTSNGLTETAHSPSSSWAPAFSDSTSAPQRSLTTIPSLATRFMPS